MPEPSTIDLYGDGDIPLEWASSIQNNAIDELEGVWEILVDRSDPCDQIMAALGINLIKRSALRSYRSRVEVTVLPQSNGDLPKIHIVTNLPLGFKKEGVVPSDGSMFDQHVSFLIVLFWSHFP